MLKYAPVVVESECWGIILPVAIYKVCFILNLTNFLIGLRINLKGVGSLANRLGLSWRNMKIQNYKYF